MSARAVKEHDHVIDYIWQRRVYFFYLYLKSGTKPAYKYRALISFFRLRECAKQSESESGNLRITFLWETVSKTFYWPWVATRNKATLSGGKLFTKLNVTVTKFVVFIAMVCLFTLSPPWALEYRGPTHTLSSPRSANSRALSTLLFRLGERAFKGSFTDDVHIVRGRRIHQRQTRVLISWARVTVKRGK